MGDDVFFAGVVDHLDRHRFGNATMLDLFESWERAGAGELDDFTTNWLRTAGPGHAGARPSRRRRPPYAAGEPSGRPAAHHPRGRGERRRRGPTARWSSTPRRPRSATCPRAARSSWTRTPRAGSRPSRTRPRSGRWSTSCPAVEDDLLRAGIWDNLRSGYHHGRLDPADVLDVAVASLPVEDTEDAERRTMHWLLGSVVPLAGPGAQRPRARRGGRQGRLDEPGSGRQLAAFRTVVSTATDVDALERLGGGDDLPEGIALDVDLRWRVLVRLATFGAVDLDRLDAELAVEPTGDCAGAATPRRTPRCPTRTPRRGRGPASPGETEVANYELTAAGIGLWRGGQESVTEPYVDRYFADLPETVQVRSGWMLADAAQYFFPRTSLDEETLDKAQALVADGSMDLSLRRRLADEADTSSGCSPSGAPSRDDASQAHRPAPRRELPRPGTAARGPARDRGAVGDPAGLAGRRGAAGVGDDADPGTRLRAGRGLARPRGPRPGRRRHRLLHRSGPERGRAVQRRHRVARRAASRDPGHRHDAASSGSSACGVCGKDTIAEALAAPGPDALGRSAARARRRTPPARTWSERRSRSSTRTAGVHAAALTTAEGELLVVREDVGPAQRRRQGDRRRGSSPACPPPRRAWS